MAFVTMAMVILVAAGACSSSGSVPSPTPIASATLSPTATPEPTSEATATQCAATPTATAVKPTPTNTSTPGPSGTTTVVTSVKHVIVIMMENHSYDDIIGKADAPYLNSLARDHSVATSYYGVVSPSLLNYMAATGGNTFFSDNCQLVSGSCSTNARSIVDLLESSGKTWKSYQESMPSACYTGNKYPYAEKHNPFIHYDLIRNDPARCAKIVPYSQLASDLGSLPTYAWITPDLCHDMHDTCNVDDSSVKSGDKWLSAEVPKIEGSPSCQPAGACLIVITFDESSLTDEGQPDAAEAGEQDNHLLTMFILSGVRQHIESKVRYNHYSLLKTIEQVLDLGTLTSNDAKAAVMTDMLPK